MSWDIMIRAVIFDLDGTLTDCDLELAKKKVSEELAIMTGSPYEAIRKKIEEIHYRSNVESIYERNKWWEQVDPTLSLQEKQRVTTLYWDCVVKTTYVKPYAMELLRALKERKVKLVSLTDYDGESYSKKERIRSLPIMAYFDMVVIAGDDTDEPKPSAQPYQHILRALKLPPSEVLMVGDKPEVDLEGARALGINTLLLEGDYGSMWEHSVADLEEILAYVEQLGTTS
jgi:putative hydrolase of the HAD superfamily